MDEKLINELKEKFLNNFPVQFTAIRPMKEQYKTLEEYHKYSVNHGKDAFLFHRKNKQELPALFFIPYNRRQISDRGHEFIQMGKKTEVLYDPKPDSLYAEMVIGCNFISDMSKSLAVTVISGILDDFNAPFYTFITEAYSLKMGSDDESIGIKGRVSDHPDRKEIMMIHTCDQIKTLGTHIDIVDNDLGKEEYHEDMGDDRRGKFSNLFKQIQSPSQTN